MSVTVLPQKNRRRKKKKNVAKRGNVGVNTLRQTSKVGVKNLLFTRED